MNPDAPRYNGDSDQMSLDDGLKQWTDGPVRGKAPAPTERPQIDGSTSARHLWVVTAHDVMHAPELCEFGGARQAKVIKHSNLTGGGPAFVGGEVVFITEATVAITGSSGRYRLRSASEMLALERAFVESGYNVWSMGYNGDTNRPNIFGASDPEWVAR